MSKMRQNWIAAFYWIGVTMTLACFAFVLTGNTELLGRFEHRSIPVSWVFGGVAVFAFLAAEACHPALSRLRKTEDRSSRLSPELEAIEL